MCGTVDMSRGSLTEFVRLSSLEPGAVVGITTVTTLLGWSNVDKVKLNRDVFGKTDWIDDAGKGVFLCSVATAGKVEMVVAFIRCAEDGVYAE